jgi:hypothetical protein
MLKAANQNLMEVPEGHSYYPEMGERAPACAIIEASLSHYGRHYYLKFAASNRARVMAAIAAAKVRFNNEDSFDSCVTGESKTTIQMTCGAYAKFRAANKAMCTSAILLD